MDDSLKARYLFKASLVREIEAGGYEARYRVIEAGGRERAVIYADRVDTEEEAESRLVYEGGPFSYSAYDATSHTDRAILTLHKDADGDMYRASIYGRPIVLDLNRSCFLRDEGEIERHGISALNVTGAYFSDYKINGKRQYEDWTSRELAERTQDRREFTVKTHRGLFHARVGSAVRIATSREQLTGKITGFRFCYRKNKAFQATFHILEGGTNDQ